MKKRLKRKISILLCILLCMGPLAGFRKPAEVLAESTDRVIPVTAYGANGDDLLEDGKAIQKALDDAAAAATDAAPQTVTIPKGTYYIDVILKIGSNTRLSVDKEAKIVRRRNLGGMIVNKDANTGSGKYESNKNIVVEGGIWDGNGGTSGYSTMKFIHCQDITIRNLTVMNNYEGHLLELAGVKDGLVTNCIFRDYKGKKDVIKEAIQLDIVHSSGMVPGGSPYDDTACQNITIKNNTIQNYQRGIGSHVSVKNIYSDTINIENNKFSDIAYEAVNAYNYKNLSVTDNQMNNTGTGVEFRTLSELPADYKKPLLVSEHDSYDDKYGLKIARNNIKNTGADAVGIRLLGTKERPIKDSWISENKFSGKADGITAFFVLAGEISGNKMEGSHNGILLANSTGNKIKNNTSKNASQNGIYLNNNSDNCVIDGNTVSESGRNGISICEVDSFEANSNKLKNNKDSGLWVSNTSGTCAIDANEVSGNKKKGIALYYVDSPVITYNILTKNNLLISDQSNDCKVEDNRVESSTGHGIEFSNISNAEVYRNLVIGSKKDGINVGMESDSFLIEDNVINKSKSNGISVDASTDIRLSGNCIDSSVQKGILLNGSQKCNVSELTKPTVKKITTSTTKVEGKVKKGMKMQMIIKGKTYKVNVDSKGNFKSSTIKRQKKGTEVKFLVMDKAKNEIEEIKKVTSK